MIDRDPADPIDRDPIDLDDDERDERDDDERDDDDRGRGEPIREPVRPRMPAWTGQRVPPTPPPPRGPVWSGPNARDRDYFDREDHTREPETDRERILREDRTARAERMVWRNVFLVLYVLALITYAVWALTREGIAWNLSAFVVLLVGSGGVGLFLVGREQGEREIEYSRSKPEGRNDADLPGLRRPLGVNGYPDDALDGR